MADETHDATFAEEQDHLRAIYAQLCDLRDTLTEEIETSHKGAADDLREMSEEIRPDFGGTDETMETLAAIETLNSVIDTYNQYHDFTVEKLQRVLLLLRQPYFAKVTLEMRPGRPPRDVYIGAAGMTDEHKRPLIVDWRSPVAETYYNQEMGPTSYQVDGRTRTVNLLLRRQFDITRDKLNSYFDTTVAIEDSLLLGALKKHHSEKLAAITATIQREQNAVIRHEDVPVLLVSGIAGSGKTSVLLQRVAYLFYQERGFLASLGLSERGDGRDGDPEELARLEEGVRTMTLEPDDLREVRCGERVMLKASSVAGAVAKFSQIPVGPRLTALVKDELHDRLDRKLAALSKSEDVWEEMLGLDVEEQVEVFGQTISPADDDECAAFALTYVKHLFSGAHDEIERGNWLRIDRIGMRVLGKSALTAAEWVYLKLLVMGGGEKSARYVMVDEVQDYTVTQLMVLARYFPRAHFMLLGDEHQAIREGTASFDQVRQIFSATHGEVETCELLTSYRSSPEITELFTSLLPLDERARLTSVQRAGTPPRVVEVADGDAGRYVAELAHIAEKAAGEEGLTAIVAADAARANWLSKQLGACSW